MAGGDDRIHQLALDYTAAWNTGSPAAVAAFFSDDGQIVIKVRGDDLDRLTATIYTVFGSSRLAGFLLFGWMGFWGALWFVRAAMLAIPSDVM